MSLDKLKWQQQINRLRYTHKELKVVETVQLDGASAFQDYYENFCAERGVDIAELNSTHKDKVDDLYSNIKVTPLDPPDESEMGDVEIAPREEDEMDKLFNKVFKKLAAHLHPDKLVGLADEQEKKKKTAMFRDALDALENKRYFTLMDYAEQYDIEVPMDYRMQAQWVKKEIEAVEEEIKSGKETYTYRFFDCDSDKERDILIKRFLRHLFGYEFDEPDEIILK